jgi:hypothetical protein
MEIILKKSNEITDVPLRIAERYIRLGLATRYIAPAPVFEEEEKEIKEKKKTKIIDDSSYT